MIIWRFACCYIQDLPTLGHTKKKIHVRFLNFKLSTHWLRASSGHTGKCSFLFTLPYYDHRKSFLSSSNIQTRIIKTQVNSSIKGPRVIQQKQPMTSHWLLFFDNSRAFDIRITALLGFEKFFEIRIFEIRIEFDLLNGRFLFLFCLCNSVLANEKTEACLISGHCFSQNESNPDDWCQQCLPEVSSKSWTRRKGK